MPTWLKSEKHSEAKWWVYYWKSEVVSKKEKKRKWPYTVAGKVKYKKIKQPSLRNNMEKV